MLYCALYKCMYVIIKLAKALLWVVSLSGGLYDFYCYLVLVRVIIFENLGVYFSTSEFSMQLRSVCKCFRNCIAENITNTRY